MAMIENNRSAIMRAVKSKNTALELQIRKIIFNLGYRYRLHSKELTGKPDLVFKSQQKAIFIHGCFWHGHDCKRGNRIPKTNQEYWINKINRNKERDRLTLEALKNQKWKVLVIWECEKSNPAQIVKSVKGFLRKT